ncbi:helix-turn-helix transcriptional regulator [Paenibacillus sp. CAU 1782]
MKRNWSSRMMFSYFPIFLLTMSILIFLSFLIVGEMSRNETAKANRISTEYVVDAVDKALAGVQQAVLQEVETNRKFDDFLEQAGMESKDDRNVMFDVVHDLRGLLYRNELIDTIYIYRKADEQVLTINGLVPVAEFPDRDFLEQAKLGENEREWSPVRDFRAYGSDGSVKVISISKQLPLPFGSEGMIVVNVSMYRLESMIKAMTNSQLSFMRVTDHNGDLVFSLQHDSAEEGRVLNRIASDRAGWVFESGIAAGELFAWMTVVTYIWIGIGVATVIAGTAYILYITRKNYRPIKVMLNRLEALQLRDETLQNASGNELVLIDQALEALIAQTVDYRERYDENLLVQRRALFLDLLEGEPSAVTAERMERLQALPLSRHSSHYAYISAEINQYAAFREKFGNEDQNVLKLTMMNLFQEMAAEEGLRGWAEWISASKLGLIVSLEGKPDNAADVEALRSLADRYLRWTSGNLGVSLAIGIGPAVPELEKLPMSRAAADNALRHKLALGQDMVVVGGNVSGPTSSKSYHYLKMIGDLVREFRLADEGWRSRLEEIFAVFRAEGISDEEIRMVLRLLVQMLGRELGEMSEGLRRILSGPGSTVYYAELEAESTLAGVQAAMRGWLAEIYRIYVTASESKSYRAMISEMKKYIEENFDNPDLSLKHLSDKFQISGKYASHLFKEEFDMKFVDFLTQLRMQRAEFLLAATSDNVQDIAQKVGYANSITFGRVFKRIVGVTPGDYRKHGMKP